MGTLFTITLYARDESIARAAAEAAFRRVSELDDVMSDYQADSELMRLSEQQPGLPVHVSAELFAVLEQAQRVSKLSRGAFDVTIGPCVRLWRFSRKRKTLPDPGELAAARQAVGYSKLHLDARHQTVTLLAPNMRLDLGGIAKGYAADKALELLKGRGCNRALVAASGDIAIGDPPPGHKGWRIAISGVEADSAHTGPALLLRNAAVSTSGDAEQFVEINGTRYSHILDPATGLGLSRAIQATVIAPNATLSDALATSVCILGPASGSKLVESLPGAATCIFWKDDAGMNSKVSSRWNGFVNRVPAAKRVDPKKN